MIISFVMFTLLTLQTGDIPQPLNTRAGERIAGRYAGSGTWYEDTGKTMTYEVDHTTRLTGPGFEMEFTHDFADQTRVHARFEMVWRTPVLFDVRIGQSIVGHGYCFVSTCKYHIATGRSFVEVSYIQTPNGVEVDGSSSVNADGHYIAWHEDLRRRE